MLRPAIFLDRDGVINHNRADHVKSWPEFEFLPGSLLALRRLARLDWPVVVVTNQAMIGRGQASRDSVDDIHARMLTAVLRAGGRIDAVMLCPHRPDEDCACRKPRPGLLLDAADALGLDLARSFMVGDAASDVMAALNAGCQPVLVKTGRGSAQLDVMSAALRGDSAGVRVNDVRVNDVRVTEDLGEAVEWITSQVAGPISQPRFVPQRATKASLLAQPGV
jgi:D-glycero-D-manno-heptose 1,7-bisphosphate phosphatase